ncbi:MAG: Smr/MutS family protein [Prevotellaceae bacterium]|jgi:DNA mismatch repair protein MutS2|nr:Smr/MutS family protein [Prevotellaceae bacterium]
MFYPENFEQKVGFDKVKAAVQVKCQTWKAKQQVEEIVFLTNRNAIELLLQQTAEMKSILMMEAFPDRGYVDIDKSMPKLKTEGAYFEASEVDLLRTALTTMGRICAFFTDVRKEKYPLLARMAGRVKPMPELIEEIDKILDRHGLILDNASKTLYGIRMNIKATRALIQKRIQAIYKKAHQDGLIDGQLGLTIRNGHHVVPVIASFKRRLKGIVVDASASGRTVFIEPLEIVELNNKIRELEFAEQREIIHILTVITASMRPSAHNIELLCNLLVEFDFIRAKAAYAIDTWAGKPLIVQDLQIELMKARNPLLIQTLSKEKKEIVPLNITLNRKQRILIVSGPNAGGKSVCIKTVGLLQYMMQCGLLIPASENSEMGVFKNIFIDIGDGQSIENDLSTYSSHLRDMKFFVERATPHSLIMIDEFGSGTDPSIGGAIAEAVLAHILKRGAFGLITTHYSNLKYFAATTDGVVNGSMLFDSEQLRPLFKLEIGKPGSSYAFEIARKIGLSEEILLEAEKKAGKKSMNMDIPADADDRNRKSMEKKLEQIKLRESQLDELTEKYHQELQNIKETRKKLIADAKAEAANILATANRTIENTVKTIKEAQAAGDTVKAARSEIEALKEAVANDVTADKSIEKEIEKVEKYLNHRGKATPPAKSPPTEGAIERGMWIQITGQKAAGEVISVNDNNVIAAIGSLIVHVPLNKVSPLSSDEYRKAVKQNTPSTTYNSEMWLKRLNFKPVLDLRGENAVNAVEQTIAFIDEAIMCEVNEVRILHGKGNGILKTEIRRCLQSISDNIHFSDEIEEAGGAGITVVRLF